MADQAPQQPEPNVERPILIALMPAQWNYILTVVGARPFAECHLLVAEIQRQAAAQQQLPTIEGAQPAPTGKRSRRPEANA